MTNYDLQVTTEGSYSSKLADITSSVSSAIGLYPSCTYQSTSIESTGTGDIVHIYYQDTSESQIEVIPLVVYAILAALAVLGVAYISYLLVVVSPGIGYGLLAIGLLIASAFFINSIRRN